MPRVFYHWPSLSTREWSWTGSFCMPLIVVHLSETVGKDTSNAVRMHQFHKMSSVRTPCGMTFCTTCRWLFWALADGFLHTCRMIFCFHALQITCSCLRKTFFFFFFLARLWISFFMLVGDFLHADGWPFARLADASFHACWWLFTSLWMTICAPYGWLLARLWMTFCMPYGWLLARLVDDYLHALWMTSCTPVDDFLHGFRWLFARLADDFFCTPCGWLFWHAFQWLFARLVGDVLHAFRWLFARLVDDFCGGVPIFVVVYPFKRCVGLRTECFRVTILSDAAD